MSRVNIHGADYPIGKVFSNEFVFTIPVLLGCWGKMYHK